MNRLIEAGQLDRLKVTEGDCTLTSQPQSMQARGLTMTIPFRGSQSPAPLTLRPTRWLQSQEKGRGTQAPKRPDVRPTTPTTTADRRCFNSTLCHQFRPVFGGLYLPTGSHE